MGQKWGERDKLEHHANAINALAHEYGGECLRLTGVQSVALATE